MCFRLCNRCSCIVVSTAWANIDCTGCSRLLSKFLSTIMANGRTWLLCVTGKKKNNKENVAHLTFKSSNLIINIVIVLSPNSTAEISFSQTSFFVFSWAHMRWNGSVRFDIFDLDFVRFCYFFMIFGLIWNLIVSFHFISFYTCLFYVLLHNHRFVFVIFMAFVAYFCELTEWANGQSSRKGKQNESDGERSGESDGVGMRE